MREVDGEICPAGIGTVEDASAKENMVLNTPCSAVVNWTAGDGTVEGMMKKSGCHGVLKELLAIEVRSLKRYETLDLVPDCLDLCIATAAI
jgi:hypothetical protein